MNHQAGATNMRGIWTQDFNKWIRYEPSDQYVIELKLCVCILKSEVKHDWDINNNCENLIDP
jgi:hypothetical protein